MNDNCQAYKAPLQMFIDIVLFKLMNLFLPKWLYFKWVFSFKLENESNWLVVHLTQIEDNMKNGYIENKIASLLAIFLVKDSECGPSSIKKDYMALENW